MNIAIIGYGIVGRATHQSFLAMDQSVTIYEIDSPYHSQSVNHDLIFVCVPTTDQQDIEALRDLCLKILSSHDSTLLCIRSSVPIGFVSQQLAMYSPRVIYFPEFLRERRWMQDAATMSWIIGCHPDMQQVFDRFCINKQATYVTVLEAEIIKMMANSFAAMNVVFANHIYDISTKLGARYHVVEAAHDQVRHRDQNYLKVTPELRGFGGKCLPKDLAFLIKTFEQYDISQSLFNSIQQDNNKWPTTVRIDP